MLVELIEAMHKREAGLLAEKVLSLDSLEDLLAQFMAQADLLEQDKECRKFINFMSMQVEWATEKQIFARLRDGHLRNAPFEGFDLVLHQEQQRGRIRQDVDVEEILDILVGMFIGMVKHSLSGMAKRPLKGSIRTAMQAVFDSIRA